mmetsp:Transcript_11633/g.36129  ORF Transcript_11633/g.36129 Transcript_11633/m.36129 type:complete len:217 (+) Transcript_11633:436-1086(+)
MRVEPTSLVAIHHGACGRLFDSTSETCIPKAMTTKATPHRASTGPVAKRTANTEMDSDVGKTVLIHRRLGSAHGICWLSTAIVPSRFGCAATETATAYCPTMDPMETAMKKSVCVVSDRRSAGSAVPLSMSTAVVRMFESASDRKSTEKELNTDTRTVPSISSVATQLGPLVMFGAHAQCKRSGDAGRPASASSTTGRTDGWSPSISCDGFALRSR